MPRWVLTDTARDVWVEQIHLGNENVALPGNQGWSVVKRRLRGGKRDGVDAVEVNNGSLAFTVLPTRGMGIWRGCYRGKSLGWNAPLRGPVHPQWVNLNDRGGIGWLAGFDEWLCRCGLAFNGPPGEDVWTDASGSEHREQITLHGRIANLPAEYVELSVDESTGTIAVTGRVQEGFLFGGRLQLTCTIETAVGSNRLTIRDRIDNLSDTSAEIELLYHLNFGPPFLEAGGQVAVPIREMSPLTQKAAVAIDSWNRYRAPEPGFAEEVFCFFPAADAEGNTLAVLENADGSLAAAVRFNTRQLPCFTVWKNTAGLDEGFVTGLEPAINFPNFRGFERKQGRVPTLPPKASVRFDWSIEVADGAEQVAALQSEVDRIQAAIEPTIHRQPHPKFSAAAQPG